MKPRYLLSVLLFAAAMVSPAAAAAAEDRPVVTLMTHDSFAMSEAVFKTFENHHNATLKILKSGDAGAALNQAILSRRHPLADAFFGVDNTFLSRALDAGIFVPHPAPDLSGVPRELQLDPQGRLLPIDFGDVCLNYDRDWFAERGLAPPSGLADLIDPAYRGLTVVQNPATSSPGLAFLLTTIGTFGENGCLDFWRRLRDNDVYVANGWSDAYYGQFSRAGGTRPIVVSYASSPAAEVFYSKGEVTRAPTAAVLGPGSAFRQIEFAGILDGAARPDLARQLIDFMLAPAFQKDIPLQMWVFPAFVETPLPEIFQRHSRKAEQPVAIAPAEIERNREEWIERWTEAVLR